MYLFFIAYFPLAFWLEYSAFTLYFTVNIKYMNFVLLVLLVGRTKK